MKTVSVIVPVYQVSNYVERCLESVMKQTYKDIECIIIDDATKDDSIDKCERMIGEYDGPIRFLIIHHEHNRGRSAARNSGTDAATGDYLYYLDSDDYISQDSIEKLLQPVIADDAIEMVQGNCLIRCNGSESLVYKRNSFVPINSNEDARTQFLVYHNLYISVWNKLLKRTFVEENGLYCKEGIVHEDYLWMFYLTKYLKHAYLSEAVTYYHPIRSGSIVTGTDMRTKGECFCAIFDDILHHLTVGYERQELKGYQYIFYKRYLTFVEYAPTFRDTASLYMKCARQYGLWYVYVVIIAVRTLNLLGNPIALLEPLNTLRWKVKRWLKKCEDRCKRHGREQES